MRLSAVWFRQASLGVALGMALAACATGSSLSKPGFYTEVKDGRPARQVTRVGGGPSGMTIKSSDAAVIDAYLAAK